MKLKDKVAIVAGGGRDIGKAVSIRLAAEGAKVLVVYANDEAAARATVNEIVERGGRAVLHRADLTQAADAERMCAAAREAFGARIDVLVNLAGGLVARKTLAEMDEAFFDCVLALNLKTTFLATKAVLPCLGAGASIINFSSQAARDGGGAGASAYATAKGAVMSFTRALAKELGPKGIRVNALCCGMIATSFHDTFTKPEVRTAVAGMTPLRREGRSEEVADVVAFLASEEAAFVNGTCLDVNGGLVFS
ncbi:MAG: SDR family NAD(P)-dependent oxidoreductase [Gammaproteobacteria bacterium]